MKGKVLTQFDDIVTVQYTVIELIIEQAWMLRSDKDLLQSAISKDAHVTRIVT